MNNQLNHYISIEPDFFQELAGEFGVKITGKLANFLRTVEIVRPNRIMTSEMKWCGVGRKKLDREKFFRAFLLKAEKAALQAKKEEEIRTRHLALQPFRTLPENLADLPEGCDKCGKKNSKGDTEWWIGYKLHFDVSDSGIPLAAILT